MFWNKRLARIEDEQTATAWTLKALAALLTAEQVRAFDLRMLELHTQAPSDDMRAALLYMRKIMTTNPAEPLKTSSESL